MRQLITLALALSAALIAGCGSLPQKVEPAHASPEPAVQANAVTQTPAPAERVLLPAPEKYEQLQPFKKFKKGEGKGMTDEYTKRDRKEFRALVRNQKLAKRIMRVGWEKQIAQMREARPELPFTDRASFLAALEHDPDLKVVSCKNEWFTTKYWLTVTNHAGTAWGVEHRRCYKGELVLTYKGVPLMSTTCLNVAIPVPPKEPPKAPVPYVATAVQPPPQTAHTTASCPNGYTLIGNVWSLQKLPGGFLGLGGLRGDTERLIQEAAGRDSADATRMDVYGLSAVSRTLGKRLREEAKVRADLAVDVMVRYLDVKTGKAVQDLGSFKTEHGVGTFRFPSDPRGYIVETVWPAYFISPVMSGGERRLRIFPSEWGACAENIHAVVP